MIIHNFNSNESQLYEEFRKLQYQCFVKEQGWDIPSDHKNSITLEDEHHQLANYTLVQLDGEFIGSGKSFIYSENFLPYGHLYKEVLNNSFFKQNLNEIAVVNGVCFKASFREAKNGIKEDERRVRLLRRLTLELLINLHNKNVELALFSTGISEVAFSCHKLGFKPIMEPIPFDGPIPTICSMAGHIKSILQQNTESYANLVSSQKSHSFINELNNICLFESGNNLPTAYLQKLTSIKSILKS